MKNLSLIQMLVVQLLFAVLMLSPGPGTVSAQEDPFKGDGKVEEDPFGDGNAETEPAEEEREAEAKPRADSPQKAELDERALRDEIAALERKLDEAKMRLSALAQHEERSRHNHANQIEKLVEKNAMQLIQQGDLLSALLTSKDPGNLSLALNHLIDMHNASSSRFGRIPLQRDALSAMESLLDSQENSTRSLATQAIVACHPRALELGFQKQSDRWLPIPEEDKGTQLTRTKLAGLCTMDYYETLLEDVIDELKGRKLFVVKPDDLNNEQLITLKCYNTPMSEALCEILNQVGLVYRVRHDHVTLHPIDDPQAVISMSYAVRGLLTESLGVQGLEAQLSRRFEGSKNLHVDFESVDEYRLLVTATEFGHDQVSKYLATLAKGRAK